MDYRQKQQQRDADIAEIQRMFPFEAVQGNANFFMRNPLPERRRQNTNARTAMNQAIFVHRPQVNLLQSPDDVELQRNNLLYLVRLAPLTRQLPSGESALTDAGNFFPTIKKMVRERRIDASVYQGWYAAKYGFTTVTVRRRFSRLLSHLRGKRFPIWRYPPVYAVCILGLLSNSPFLRRMESCLRNMFTRHMLRLRQHAQGELLPGNVSSSSEMVEFVFDDEQRSETFLLMQKFAIRLDAARFYVRGLERRLRLRQEELTAMDIDEQEELTATEVDVYTLYSTVLEYAAASIDV